MAVLPEGGSNQGSTESDMPIYEYVCQDCERRFDRLWPTAAAAEGQQPVCPTCASMATRRAVSQVAVVGKLGGMTPQEQSGANAEAARKESFTPKEQIQALQVNRKRKREQGT